jgi:dienelactone hydrolase
MTESAGEGVTEPVFTHPESISVDEEFSIEITELSANSVDIQLSATAADGTEWTSHTTTPVTDGVLELRGEPSNDAGSDISVPHLLQEATPVQDAGPYSPDPDDCDELTITVEEDGERLGSTSVDRTFGTCKIESSSVDSEDFVGTVYDGSGDGPAPGIVVLHGSGGEPSHATARLLASHGFVTLALHYFDWRGRHELLPQQLVDVPLGFVESATDWLLDHPGVDGSQVGLWGVSKGGEFALLSGARLDSVGPVVSVNGSAVVWQGFTQGRPIETASWKDGEESLPYVPYTDDPSVWDNRPPMELEPAYSRSYREAGEAAIDQATIAVESIDGPVLLVSGADDRMWDSVTLQGIGADRLAKHGCEYDHLIYEDAGHAITYPYLPTANRGETGQFVMGGTQSGYAEADRNHWPEVTETFETLRR